MVNGYRITYKFGSPEAYVLRFSEIVQFQYGLDYRRLADHQQVLIQLICHAMDQLATGGESGKSDRVFVKWVGLQKDWELKDANNPEKGFELRTSIYTNSRLYLYYNGSPVFGLAESTDSDCCVIYLDPKCPAENWIDEVLELAFCHAESFGALSCFK